ncbi:uncharacterized protein B0H18DRAFT_508385 [Fomitopsis serialis]|uniref:uncharacterized protein n=1 Tax=Fomitopsis serialis TaxID=139415 RepID=UPI002007DFA5|nr:uncharacterized protein B0H18DRAFT_508385 [Neoantrodia serialis]KAH9922671.1 hypothetical protein B0H18DRAFT_508385 [Neoantrodia serialis]
MSARQHNLRSFMTLPSLPNSLKSVIALLLFVATGARAIGTTTNRTIDDFYGDSATGAIPLYSDGWNYGPQCSGCFIQPAIGETFDQSWHDVTASPTDPAPKTVTLSFNGTAIWVYGVVPNYVEYATTLVNVSFELDGKVVGLYTHAPSASVGYIYNVTLYSNTAIANGQHTLVMTPQRESNSSYLAFDWAQYTFEDVVSSSSSATTQVASTARAGTTSSQTTVPSPSGSSVTASVSLSSSRTPFGAIAGGVIGGLGLLAIIALVFFWHRRYRHSGADKIRIVRSGEGRGCIEPAAEHDPFVDPFMSQVNAAPATTGAPRDCSPSSFVMSTTSAPTTATFLHVANAPSTIVSESDVGSNPSASSSETQSTAASGGTHRKEGSSTSLWALPVDTPSGSRDVLPSSNTPTNTAAATESPVASKSARRPKRRGTKATMQREELSRQMRDIETAVADLRRRQSSQSAQTALSSTSLGDDPVPPLPGSPPPEHDDSELRRQIEALQLEVERLRAEQDVLLREPPPAYEYEQEDGES